MIHHRHDFYTGRSGLDDQIMAENKMEAYCLENTWDGL